MINTTLNLVAIIILIVYTIVCIIKKISFKIAFIIGVIYLLISAVFLIFDREESSINLALISYYLLIVTAILAITEYLRDMMKIEKEKTPKDTAGDK